MPNNIGYLTAATTAASDEVYTPEYAVEPIIKHISVFFDNNATIWCPFDEKDSNFVILLKKAGYNVISSHIKNGQDFFTYEPEEEYLERRLG